MYVIISKDTVRRKDYCEALSGFDTRKYKIYYERLFEFLGRTAYKWLSRFNWLTTGARGHTALNGTYPVASSLYYMEGLLTAKPQGFIKYSRFSLIVHSL